MCPNGNTNWNYKTITAATAAITAATSKVPYGIIEVKMPPKNELHASKEWEEISAMMSLKNWKVIVLLRYKPKLAC